MTWKTKTTIFVIFDYGLLACFAYTISIKSPSALLFGLFLALAILFEIKYFEKQSQKEQKQ